MTLPPKLFPYQEVGSDWLSDRRLALLADEMGLGKSAQTLTAADNIAADRILIICPAVARANWLSEIGKFSRFHRVFDMLFQRKQSSVRSIVTSYELSTGVRGEFDLLIIDEAHYLKNAQAKRSQEIMGDGGIARRCKRIWALTGTPMPNHPGELWVWLRSFGRTNLSYDKFCEEYCNMLPGFKNHKRIVGAKKEKREELRKLLAPVMLKRTAKEVGLELPELFLGDLVVEPGYVHLPPDVKQRALEQEDWLREQLEGVDLFSPEQMGLLEMLAASVSTLRLYNGLQKVNPIQELVSEELKSNQYGKILIFGIHQVVISRLAQGLGQFGMAVINGKVSSIERERGMTAFRDSDRCRVMICNIKAAGTAINLTAADQVLFVESEWSPADNLQALKRAHRIGREKPVFVRFAGIRNSIDEKIQKSNRRKAADIDAILG